jgi:hypothetical protein
LGRTTSDGHPNHGGAATANRPGPNRGAYATTNAARATHPDPNIDDGDATTNHGRSSRL